MKKAFIFVLILIVLASLFVTFAYAEEPAVSTEQSEGETISAGVDDPGAVSEAAKDSNINLSFSAERFPTALRHMAIGMIGVLVVLSLIALVVFLLNRVSKPR